MAKNKLGASISGLLLVGALVGGFICTEKIPTGYVGVQFSMNGGVSDEVLTEGWHLVSPAKKVTLYSIATESFVMTKDERSGSKDDESFTVTCKDGEINVDFEMQYTYDSDDVVKVFKKYRGIDGDTVVSSNLRTKIKTVVNEVLSEYTVLEAHLESKAEVNKALSEALREKLGEMGIYVESATLSATRVSSDIQEAIANRTKVAQELEAEKQKQEKAKLEAETKRIQAQAEADAKVIKAQAEADANKLLEQSITDGLIKMKEAEARLKHGWVEITGADSVVVKE